MREYGSYPLSNQGRGSVTEGYDEYEDLGYGSGFGQVATPTPTFPVTVAPPQSLIQQVTGFFGSPFGLLFLVAGGIFVADRLGYIDVSEILKGKGIRD